MRASPPFLRLIHAGIALLGAGLALAPWSPSLAALPENPTAALAGLLTPPALSPNAGWQGVFEERLAPIFTLMEMAEVQSAIGGEELLRKAYQTRKDIGPMRKMAATAVLSAAWREARALGMFNEEDRFQMRITRGPDKGNHALFNHIVPYEAAPQFACEFANVRIVAPGRAEGVSKVSRVRDAAYVRTLNAIASEENGMQADARRQEELWKREMESDGAKALELPRVTLMSPHVIASPSNRSGYKWKVQVEIINVSLNATEVDLECILVGVTDKHRQHYIMGQEKRTLRLRGGQAEKVTFATPLTREEYKRRTDDFERLSQGERAGSKAYYRAAIFRVHHAKGVAATAVTYPSMMSLLKADAPIRLPMLPKLHLDPKTWGEPYYLK